MFYRSKTCSGQSGQTLIEIIITTAIIVVAITAILGLVTHSLVATGISKTKIQASFLAQEAIEIVYNIRDTSQNKELYPWDTNFYDSVNGDGWYKVGAYDSVNGWSLTYTSNSPTPDPVVDGIEIEIDGIKYTRYIKVIKYNGEDNKREITVMVTWGEPGSTNQVEVSSILTDYFIVSGVCFGACDVDNDGDTYTEDDGDCDDRDAGVYPGVGDCPAPPTPIVTNIDAGGYHSLALKDDDTVWSWGLNSRGQLGDNTTTRRSIPGQVLGPGGSGFLTDVKAISTGHYFSLVLKNDGTVWAWGENWAGQLGDGTTTERHTPVQVKGPGGSGFLTDVKDISAGWYHAIATKNDGTIWAWGYNNHGQLCDNTITYRYTPVQVLGPGGSGVLTDIGIIYGGDYHSLFLKNDSTVWGCGWNVNGSLGDNTTTERRTPVQALGPGGSGFLTDVKDISAGYRFSIALKNDGTVWTMGNNWFGQLGDDTIAQRLTPVQVLGPGGSGFLTDVKDISAGYRFSLVLKNDGTAWTWGQNTFGQLGDDTTTERHTPVQVLGLGGIGFLTDIGEISAGTEFCISLDNNDIGWSWGYNRYGMLGDGTETDRYAPVQIIF